MFGVHKALQHDVNKIAPTLRHWAGNPQENMDIGDCGSDRINGGDNPHLSLCGTRRGPTTH